MNVTIDNLLLSQAFEVIAISYTQSAIVTEHPIELGAEVSDHVQPRSRAFTADLIVPSSPTGVVPTPFAVQQALSFLDAAIGQRLTVSIPGDRVYSNMVIASSTHRLVGTPDRRFSISFRQVRIALAISVNVPPFVPAAGSSGVSSLQDHGQQSGVPGVPESALYSIGSSASAVANTGKELLKGMFGR